MISNQRLLILNIIFFFLSFFELYWLLTAVVHPTLFSFILLSERTHLRAWYTLQALIPNAMKVSDVCRIRLLLSSFLTRNVGEDGPNTASSSMCGSLLVSVSTWYWQHGSNCHETVYNPQVTNAMQPKGPHM